MSKRIKQNTGLMMALMASAFAGDQNSMMFSGRGDDAYLISPKLKHKFNFLIPKGAKLYLFKSDGKFESFTEFASRDEMPDYCVFYTIALNDKSAIIKFNKFMKK